MQFYKDKQLEKKRTKTKYGVLEIITKDAPEKSHPTDLRYKRRTDNYQLTSKDLPWSHTRGKVLILRQVHSFAESSRLLFKDSTSA